MTRAKKTPRCNVRVYRQRNGGTILQLQDRRRVWALKMDEGLTYALACELITKLSSRKRAACEAQQ